MTPEPVLSNQGNSFNKPEVTSEVVSSNQSRSFVDPEVTSKLSSKNDCDWLDDMDDEEFWENDIDPDAPWPPPQSKKTKLS